MNSSIYQKLTFCFLFLLISFLGNAQSTFSELYDIMQTKCVTCHSGPVPEGNLDLSGNENQVYDNLIDINPNNSTALAMGNKLIMPGYPERSFLLRKISTPEWDSTFGLYSPEGTTMPQAPNQPLSSKEIELFRQWIIWGAPKNQTVIDPQILEDFYENGMGLPVVDPIDPPAAGEGFQVRVGPIFLEPLQEIEFFKKHDLQLDENVEVNQLGVNFNNESHHFIVYKMDQWQANNVDEGIREIPFEQANGSLLAVWQTASNYSLPENTAYKVSSSDVADMNYHLKNYLTSGILQANVYVNFYTQPEGTAEHEMKSELLPINLTETFLGAPIGNGLEIPNDGVEHVFTDHLVIPDFPAIPYPSGDWHIWQLSTHTHSRGTDYDIYVANPDGSKGEQIYEGFYNSNYTFNQGYFDFEHPPVRTFDELKVVDMGLGGGLIHEAKYVNNTAAPISWGYTTDDEMMLLFVHFTTEPISTSVNEVLENKIDFNVFPNPTQGESNITYTLEQKASVQIEVFNLLGEKIETIANENQPAGNYQFSFLYKNITEGMYLVRLSINGEHFSKKIMKN